MRIPMKVNSVPVTVEFDHYIQALDVHIEKLSKMIGHELKTKMILRNFVEVDIYNEDGETIWGSTLWVPPATHTITTSDGHGRKIELDSFVQIVDVIPGIPGMELEPISPLSPTNTDLLYDINNPTGLGFNIIAKPTCTEDRFDWNFNAGNGLLAFYEQYQNHKMIDRDTGLTRVILYHNHYMGYHFDKATRQTILRYYKPKGVV